jgi:hypothetical protein
MHAHAPQLCASATGICMHRGKMGRREPAFRACCFGRHSCERLHTGAQALGCVNGVLRKRAGRATRASARMRDSDVPSQKPCPFACSSSSGYSSGSDLMSQYWWRPRGLAAWAGPCVALAATDFAAFSALAVTGFPCCKRRTVCSYESAQQLRSVRAPKACFVSR